VNAYLKEKKEKVNKLFAKNNSALNCMVAKRIWISLQLKFDLLSLTPS
jgi:hypothetical protein